MGVPASVRSRARGSYKGRLSPRRSPGRKPASAGPHSLRAGGSGIHCRATHQRREARGADHACELSGTARTADRRRDRIQGCLRLSPQYAIAAINLADLYRRLGRDGDGETVLRAALVTSSHDAGVRHALGLALTKLKRPDEALAEFRTATELEPGNQQYAYVYAVALHSGGRPAEAVAVLNEALQRHPYDRSVLSALVAFNRASGNEAAALAHAERPAAISPPDSSLTRLINELRQAASFAASAHLAAAWCLLRRMSLGWKKFAAVAS